MTTLRVWSMLGHDDSPSEVSAALHRYKRPYVSLKVDCKGCRAYPKVRRRGHLEMPLSRTAGSNGPRTAAAIRSAGLKLIYRHGFEAMSLRDLAAEVGIQPASLYNHIRTKQDLLFALVREHMDMLLAQTDAAIAAAGDGAMQRLRAFIAHHLAYHLQKKQEVFIANFELRALEPQNYAAIIAMRRSYEERLVALLRAGDRTGDLEIQDFEVTAYAILAMLTGACTWYKPDGRLSKQALVTLHTDLILLGCCRRSAAKAPDGPSMSAAPAGLPRP